MDVVPRSATNFNLLYKTVLMQVFRSIDSGSTQGFPKDVQEAESQNLVCAKNLVIDKSIKTAYIEAIRSA
uniref:Uncharacterized protein n=1 Tax=Chenopodium quinoa TaxID=63459 RepID=A0A803MR39_CHEQI